MSFNVYIGAYLEVGPIFQKDKISMRVCNNKKCKNSKITILSPYCPLCGTNTEVKNIGSKRQVEVITWLFNNNLSDEYSQLFDNSIILNTTEDDSNILLDEYSAKTYTHLEIPKEDWTPFKTVMQALDKDNIKYSKKFGVFSYDD